VPDDRHDGMVDVFVERHGLPATSGHGEPDMAAAACCDLHRARWQRSYVAEAGPRICHYRAPDAESVRLAFRKAGIAVDAIWTGTVYGDTTPSTEYVVVDLQFFPPLPADASSALERAEAEGLLPIGLRLAQAIVSAARGRVICLCEAPVGELIPMTASADGTGWGRVWSCRSIAGHKSQ
jgi:hypothetical protein